MPAVRRITVYCASSDAIPAEHHALAVEMGERIAARDWEVVFGGGATGLMGSLARAALARGGRVRGVILRQFVEMGIGFDGLSSMEVLDDMRPRKARLEELAHACVALPGGFGTFEELLEVLVRKQLGLHAKPIVVLNHLGYYDPLLHLFERAFEKGFVDSAARGLYQVALSAAEAMDILERSEKRSPRLALEPAPGELPGELLPGFTS